MDFRNFSPMSLSFRDKVQMLSKPTGLQQRRQDQTLDMLRSPRLPSRLAPRTALSPNQPLDVMGLLQQLLGQSVGQTNTSMGGGLGGFNLSNGGTSLNSGGGSFGSQGVSNTPLEEQNMTNINNTQGAPTGIGGFGGFGFGGTNGIVAG